MLEVVRQPGQPGKPRVFPWDEMEVGEHFIVQGRTVDGFTGTLAYANKSRAPKRFTSRDNLCGVTVRRVE